ncbi:MAG: LysR family transcriptional regulator [Gammaproteobacteria bacterium]|nr:MAG: LysR family transcriptional regulator [Gammaproteobacteria bacterium]UTW41893.1 LysR family transcriptional regulator [bacterium SCSIO 12844]
MNIKDLIILKKIVDEKNISLAAEKMHITQPAASNILKRLREKFNDELIIISGQSFILTPTMQDIYAQISVIIETYEQMINKHSDFDPHLSDLTYKIGTISPYPEIFCKPLLKTLTTNYPSIKVEIDILPLFYNFHKYSTEYDLIIGTYEAPDNYIKELLFEDQMVVAHKGALDHTETLTLDEYMNLKHLVGFINDEESFVTKVLKNSDTRDIKFAINSQSHVIDLLDEHHVATVSKLYANYLQLKYLPFPLEDDRITCCIYYPYWFKNLPSNIWFRELTKNIITSEIKQFFDN